MAHETLIFSTARSSPRRGLLHGATHGALLTLLLALSLPAQEPVPPGDKPAEDQPPHAITERGAHHRVWRRDNLVKLGPGPVVNRPSGYTELATGLHYLENGVWQESRDEFEVTPAGASATRGQHQVFLAGNINSPGALEIHTAEKHVLKFRPVCLAYTDAATGESVVLAPVRDAEGILFPPNVVMYPAAFAGVLADVRVSYTKAGFESDVILREKLPPPSDFGLNPATTLLEVWHEADAPEPVKSVRTADGLTDETLTFGTMRIGRGTAFALEAPTARHLGVPVMKTWLRTENRSYLIESVRLPRVQKELDQLPDRQAALPQRAPGVPPGGVQRAAGLQPAVSSPSPLPVANGQHAGRLAQLAALSPPPTHAPQPVRLAFDLKSVVPAQGLVLDYLVMNSQTAPLTLAADSTYRVTGPVSLTDLIIEGGTVVKYDVGATVYVEFYGAADCQTGPYRPAIFTAKNDDTVGETIAGSSGTPSGYYGAALVVQSAGNFLHDLRFSHLSTALAIGGDNEVRHVQFTRCDQTIGLAGCTLTLDNALFYHCSTVLSGWAVATVNARHLTAQNCFTLAHAPEADHAFNLTNSLLVNVTNWNTPGLGALNYFTNATVKTTNAAALQTVGAGAHYLATNSPYRNSGTTNLPAPLLRDLAQRTTFPPLVRSNVIYTTSTTLGLTAQRCTNAPDLGYHYAPLDYLATRLWVSNNATLTLAPGVAIAGYGTNINADFLATLGQTGSFVSEGTPLNLNQIVAHTAVQEQAGPAPRQVQWLLLTPWWTTTATVGQMRARFTAFSAPGQATSLIQTFDQSSAAPRVSLTDCQLQGGQLYLTEYTSATARLALTNNLLHRVNTAAYLTTAALYNNTVRGGTLNLFAWTNAVFDNLFDNATLFQIADLTTGHNGYTTNVTRFTPLAGNDVIVTNVTLGYDVGPLGRVYLPDSSPFQNAGSRGGRAAGLYWHTATANQQPETNSTVDLGFHYVALDSMNASTGFPLDYDLNGIANYVEDFDGHFSIDADLASLRGQSNANLVAYDPLGPTSRRTPLIISEIKYGAAANSQYIEIYNTHHLPQTLDGFTFVEPKNGFVHFTFPTGSAVNSRSFAVAFPLALPLASGQRLQLRNARGAVLLEVNYDNQAPWPKAANGTGHTLVPAHPTYGEADARSWASSFINSGSYLSSDVTQTNLLSLVRVNEILINPTNSQKQFVELFNAGNNSVNISGLRLSASKTQLNQFVLPTNTILPAHSFLCFMQGVNAPGLGLMKTNGDTLYFSSSVGGVTRVLEAVSFEGQSPGVSYGRFPDGAEEFHELNARTPKATNTPPFTRDIVITEIMFNPIFPVSTNEFVEIYNRGSTSQNLNLWGIRGTPLKFPSVNIPPQAYFVIAYDAAALALAYPGLTNGVNLFGDMAPKTLANAGQLIALTNAQGLVIDEVSYFGGGRWGKWAAGGGASLELRDLRSDNQRAANWGDSAPPTNTPWDSMSVTGLVANGDGAGNVNRLEMLMLDGGECLVDDIEVRNSAGVNLLANGTFDAGGMLSSLGWTAEGHHDLSTVTNGLGTAGTACLSLNASGRGDYLANRLHHALNSTFSVGSTCIISAKIKWQRGHPELVFRLAGGYFEAVGRMTIPTEQGTPGRANSVAQTNLGPAIYDVQHYPPVPLSNEIVTITARVSDPDGVQSLRLKYRLDPATNYGVLPMLDDGNAGAMSGDAVALDGLYTAVLPRQQVANIAFVIEAVDAFGAVTRFPTEEAQYPGDRWRRECVVRIGEGTNSSSFGSYRLWLTSSNFNRWATRGQAHNGPIDLTFINENRTIYNAGVRYAGSFGHSSFFTSPLGLVGYSLSFPGDEPFLGASALNLDYDDSDGGHGNAKTLQSEQLAMRIADGLELPNHYRRFVELYVHGSKRTGGTVAYEDTQGPNTDFINEWFPTADLTKGAELFGINYWISNYRNYQSNMSVGFIPGSLIRTSRGWPGTTNTSLDIPRYRVLWEPHALHGRGENYNALSNVIVAVENPASSGYISNVEALVDVEQWMRVSAFERALGNFDSYGWDNGQNMFGFHDLTGGQRWQLLMTDFDTVFSSVAPRIGPTAAPLENTYNTEPKLAEMRANPAFQRAFWRSIYDLANTNDGILLTNTIWPIYYGSAYELASNGYSPEWTVPLGGTNGENWIGVADVDWIAQRQTNLWTVWLPPVRPPFTNLNSANFRVTNVTTINLAGIAPVEVRGLSLNGTNVIVSWTTVTNWQFATPVALGSNYLEVVGYGRKTNSLPVRDLGGYTLRISITSTN